MSPEQMRSSANVGPSTDIWALGVILFELIAGVVPFNGAAITEVLAAVLSLPPPPLAQYRTDVPHELEAAIRRCLEKDPTARFRSIAQLAMAIRSFAPEPQSTHSLERILRVHQSSEYRATLPGEMPSVRGGQVSETHAGVASTAPGPIMTKSVSRHSVALVLGGAAIAACAIVLVIAMVARGRGSASNASAHNTGSQQALVLSAIVPLSPASEPSESTHDLPSLPSAVASATTSAEATARTTPAVAATQRKGAATSKHDVAPTTAQPPTPPAKKNPLNVDIK